MIDYENYCLSILCSQYASDEMPKGEIQILYWVINPRLKFSSVRLPSQCLIQCHYHQGSSLFCPTNHLDSAFHGDIVRWIWSLLKSFFTMTSYKKWGFVVIHSYISHDQHLTQSLHSRFFVMLNFKLEDEFSPTRGELIVTLKIQWTIKDLFAEVTESLRLDMIKSMSSLLLGVRVVLY